jgi:hypothetical protein
VSSVPDERPIIRGEHVFLRPADRDDLPLFVTWLADAEVARHLTVRAPMSQATAHEGTLRRAHFARGEHIDVLVMSLLRGEWAALPHHRSWEFD